LFEQLGMPFEIARTLLIQGQVRRRRRQKRAAHASLGRALEEFERLGAQLWAAQVRGELERVGGGRRSGFLTPSEQHVVELAAEGRSNKEIAAALFVSVHTVELHLSHAYAKLGVRSRAQLAANLRPTVWGSPVFPCGDVGRIVGRVPEFLVESYATTSQLEQARSAADAVSRKGMRVRCVRSILVPEDETCFYLYDAPSAALVRRAAVRAGLVVGRMTVAFSSSW
jgi:DNA-binding CsgD family transcriptional regulator